MIKSRTKTSVSQSHGDWTDPAAVQTLSLTQQLQMSLTYLKKMAIQLDIIHTQHDNVVT